MSDVRQIGLAPMPAVMAILDRFNREEIGNTIEVLVALLDISEPDADLELHGDEQDTDGDGDDQAWIEWSAMRGSQKAGPNIGGHEDDEDTDSDHGGDEAEPDFAKVWGHGAGCELADPGGCEHDGREHDDGV